MALNDPKKKRDENGVQIGHLRTIPGTGLDSLLKGANARQDAYGQRTREYALARGTNFVNPADPASMQASPSARLAAPVRNPVASTVGGGGSTPTGGVPASPAVAKPDFSRVQGSMLVPPKPLAEQASGIQRTVVNGVPTFTGTGAFAPAQAQQVPAAVARPMLVNPTIAPVQTPGVVNQSETTDQRRAREAALSEIGSQLFQLRGRNTRSSTALTGDLLRTQADLVNTAGNQGVALKNNNLDNQTRMDITGIQNQGENDRTVAEQSGANGRALLADTGETERARLALTKPEYVTGADGSLLSVANGQARRVTNDGNPVKMPATKAEGQVTPQVQLESLTKELEAAQQSLTPDAARIGTLQAQIDALRGGGNPQAQGALSAPGIGATRNGYQFLGGDPADPASWKKVK